MILGEASYLLLVSKHLPRLFDTGNRPILDKCLGGENDHSISFGRKCRARSNRHSTPNAMSEQNHVIDRERLPNMGKSSRCFVPDEIWLQLSRI